MQKLIERVCALLPNVEVTEKRMFGGMTLMLNGNMLCCVDKKGLMIRVGKAAENAALQLLHAHPCDWSSRKMPGFIVIAPEGLADNKNLSAGLNMALDYVFALPKKA